MNLPPPITIAIVGAGLAGLAAAFRLNRQGVSVELFEANDRVGGVVQTFRGNGFLAEEGPLSLSRPPAEARAIFREAGLESRVVVPQSDRAARFLVKDGKPVPLPTSPLGFFRTPLLSMSGRIRVLGEPFRKASATRPEDESVADLLRRRGMGEELIRHFLDPFVAGVCAGDPERISAPHAFPLLRELEEEHGSLVKGLVRTRKEARADRAGEPAPPPLFSFRGGMGEIPAALAAPLEGRLHLKTAVREVRRSPELTLLTDRGEVGPFRAVILALPAHRLARLTLPSEMARWIPPIREVSHPPVAILTLGFRKESGQHPLNGFGMLVPAVEGREVLGVLFPSTLFPGRAPAGHLTLAAFVGGTRQPELAHLPPEEIELRARREIADLLGVRGEPVFRHLKVWSRAIPQYDLGYAAVKEAIRGMEATAPDIVLAGSWTGGVSVGDTLRSGAEAAHRVMGGASP